MFKLEGKQSPSQVHKSNNYVSGEFGDVYSQSPQSKGYKVYTLPIVSI